MSEVLSKYTVLEFTVIRHAQYGLVIQSSGDGGFVDSMDIADNPLPIDEWPMVGSRIIGVLLGYAKDGRLRVSARPRDLLLVRSLDSPAGALARWVEIRELSPDSPEVQDFFRSSDATPVLRWAINHRSGSIERERALALVAVAPSHLRSALGEIHD